MSTFKMNLAPVFYLIFVAGLSLAAAAPLPPALSDAPRLSPGVVCVVGAGGGSMAVEMAKSGSWTVLLVDADDRKLEEAREKAVKADVPGRFFSTVRLTGKTIPLAPNQADLLVVWCEDPKSMELVDSAECVRVVTPYGKVALTGAPPVLSKDLAEKWLSGAGLQKIENAGDGERSFFCGEKPALPGADDWSHWYHGPDNNPVSSDTVIRWPYATQWMGEPFHDLAFSTTLHSAGRVFRMTDDDTRPSKFGKPLLTARNAYNGALLWKRDLSEKGLNHRSGAVAEADAFYLLEEAAVLCLDPATGQEKKRIPLGDGVGEGKSMFKSGDTLLVLAGDKVDAWTITSGNPKAYQPDTSLPWLFGKTLVALDVRSGKTVWTHQEPGPIDSRTVGVSGGKLFFYAPGSRVACLDIRDGKILWVQDKKEALAILDEFTVPQGIVLQYFLRSSPAILCTPEVVTLRRRDQTQVVALSAADGSVLWSKPMKPGMWGALYQFYHGGCLYATGDLGIMDPLTGVKKEAFKYTQGGCGRLTANADAVYSQSGRAYDFRSKKQTGGYSIKSVCIEGLIPGQGLLFGLPYSCICNRALRGAFALGPAEPGFPDSSVKAPAPEKRGDLASAPVASCGPSDWATYRANSARSGFVPVTVTGSAGVSWSYSPPQKELATPPVCAGGKVLFGTDSGAVRCLEAGTGKLVWSYWAQGRVMVPPTVADGRAYVGSADGFVHCLDMTDGRLLWKFQATPKPRRLMVYGYLSDTWPVHSGVLVENGVAYFSAGINCWDGTWVYALDAATGSLKWENNQSGWLDKEDRNGVSGGGLMALASGKVWTPGGVHVSPAGYDANTGAHWPTATTKGNRRGAEIGVLEGQYIACAGNVRYGDHGSRMELKGCGLGFRKILPDGTLDPAMALSFDGLIINPVWDSTHFFTAQKVAEGLKCIETKNLLERLAESAGKAESSVEKKSKMEAVPGVWSHDKRRLWGLALGNNAVVAAYGTSAKVGADGIESGWAVGAFDRATGAALWEVSLPSEPLVSGLCLDIQGNVVVTMKDGGVLSVGQKTR